MKLIVGLGNPGDEYINTRHNMGFRVIDSYAKKNGLVIDKNRFGGLYLKTKIKNKDVLLLKPQKYINLSGEVLKKYIDYFKVDISDVLVISDDLDLDLGKIKLKYKGSSGGHNGLKNIEANIGTKEYKRLKMGISNNKFIDTKDYVLGNFSHDEEIIVKNSVDFAVDIIDDYLKNSFEKVMSKYN